MLSSNRYSSCSSSSSPPLPQKENLTFEVSTDGLDEQTTQLVLHIKEVAESVLFHWKSFPIVLPTPVAVQHEPFSVVFQGSELRSSSVNETELDSNNRQHVNSPYEVVSSPAPDAERSSAPVIQEKVRPLVLKDAFITPSFDELDAVAIDPKGDSRKLSPGHLNCIRQKGNPLEVIGKRRKLSEYQLEMLRCNGEFEVESLHFPGQKHRWRVSECLQKGSERIYETFLNDLAFAASIIIVTAKNRISSYTFSLKESLCAIWNGILGLVDLFFGIQWVQAHNLEARIKEERCSYLVQELTAKDGEVEELCAWILSQVKRATREKFHLNGNRRQPQVPYLFTTPQGLELNLKLFNRELMKKMLPILVGILEKESRGWFLHFREKTISELKSQGLNEFLVEKEGNRRVQEEYLRRVYSSVLENPTLKDLGEDIPQLLVDQTKAVLLMHQSLDEVEKIYSDGERERLQDLQHIYPVLSRISVWVDENLSTNHDLLVNEHKWRTT
ncbi:hypothetical protein Avbf_06294 [Armadillidium vulgare]|nr:hypothetical protein Avbf_06294 [Armadillidium vulgare]